VYVNLEASRGDFDGGAGSWAWATAEAVSSVVVRFAADGLMAEGDMFELEIVKDWYTGMVFVFYLLHKRTF